MTFTSPMSDVLDGSSLVVAVLVAFFAMWQGEITAAIDAKVEPDKLNRGPAKKQVARALWGRAVPLFAITFAAFLILACRAWSLVSSAWNCFVGWTPEQKCHYDDVGGLFLLTEVLLLALAIAIGIQSRGLWKKRSELQR